MRANTFKMYSAMLAILMAGGVTEAFSGAGCTHDAGRATRRGSRTTNYEQGTMNSKL